MGGWLMGWNTRDSVRAKGWERVWLMRWSERGKAPMDGRVVWFRRVGDVKRGLVR